MATMAGRMLSVEFEVNQLKCAYDHLATKADLAALESRLTMRLGGLIVVTTGIIVTAMRLWQ